MSGGSLTVMSSTFTNNTAPFGGVMDALDGSVEIMNSTYTNNTAGRFGGVMYTEG